MYSVFFFTYFILCVGFVICAKETKNNATQSWSYCKHPDCSIKNQHTLCLAAGKYSPRLIASGMTHWMRYQILLLHNRHRDTVALGLEPGQPSATNMRKMYWDNELEEMAEVWARQCQKRHDECRNTIRFNVLQNMDVRPVVSRVTEAQILSDAVGSWFSGSRVLPPDNVWTFKAANCSAVGGCNANWYSAAAWGSTWRLGCSQALCTAKRPACSIFRQKRTMHDIPHFEISNHTETSSENLLLRRTRFMDETPSTRFGDFSQSRVKINSNESPLHRGIIENFLKKKEVDEPLHMIAFTFCNYGPAGNIPGFPIYEAGTPCTNCPQGTQCVDKTHRALCSFLQDPDAIQN